MLHAVSTVGVRRFQSEHRDQLLRTLRWNLLCRRIFVLVYSWCSRSFLVFAIHAQFKKEDISYPGSVSLNQKNRPTEFSVPSLSFWEFWHSVVGPKKKKKKKKNFVPVHTVAKCLVSGETGLYLGLLNFILAQSWSYVLDPSPFPNVSVVHFSFLGHAAEAVLPIGLMLVS